MAEYALTPGEGPHVEVLTFDFPVVKPDHAVLRLRWGTTAIPLRIDVPGWEPYALDPEDRPRYLGTYELVEVTDDGEVNRLGLWEDGGYIQGVWYEPEPGAVEVADPTEARGFRFQAVPLGMHRFLAGRYRDGELVNTEDGFFLFTLDEEGAASGVEWRTTGEDGEEIVEARGERIR